MDEKYPASEPCGIYPLHGLDDTLLYRALISRLMRFNDVLDADKLHEALLGLFEIGDWRKLGGRLRVKVKIYVTACFKDKWWTDEEHSKTASSRFMSRSHSQRSSGRSHLLTMCLI